MGLQLQHPLELQLPLHQKLRTLDVPWTPCTPCVLPGLFPQYPYVPLRLPLLLLLFGPEPYSAERRAAAALLC
jgi:hypothetical protein